MAGTVRGPKQKGEQQEQLERAAERQATLETLGECTATHPRAAVGLLQRFTSNHTRAPCSWCALVCFFCFVLRSPVAVVVSLSQIVQHPRISMSSYLPGKYEPSPCSSPLSFPVEGLSRPSGRPLFLPIVPASCAFLQRVGICAWWVLPSSLVPATRRLRRNTCTDNILFWLFDR